MSGEHIGARLRRWRQRRGLTQRVLADLAGFSQGYVAQIEAGVAPLDRRASQEAFARALQISVGELTDRYDGSGTYQPVGPGAMAALRSGVIALSCMEIADSVDVVGLETRKLNAAALDGYFDTCQYDVLVPALGNALTILSCRLRTAVADRDRQVYLREIVRICSTAVSTCIQLGQPDLALVMAESAMRAAEELAEPAMLGVAYFARIRAVCRDTRGVRLAEQGIKLLSAHVGSDPATASVYGMHHLIAAELAARAGEHAVSLAHLDEAGQVAAYTGECAGDGFGFGPTNVGIWRMAILVTLGDGPAALTHPPEFRLDALSSANRHRRAYFFIDRSRALLQVRGRESEAAAALYQAEAIAPQQVCVSDDARGAVRTLLSRPRFGRDSRLRGLANRIGIPS